MEMEHNFFQMVIIIMANIDSENHKDLEITYERIILHILVILSMDLNKNTESGKNQNRKLQINIKDNIKMIWKMDLEYLNGLVEIFIRVNLLMIKDKE